MGGKGCGGGGSLFGSGGGGGDMAGASHVGDCRIDSCGSDSGGDRDAGGGGGGVDSDGSRMMVAAAAVGAWLEDTSCSGGSGVSSVSRSLCCRPPFGVAFAASGDGGVGGDCDDLFSLAAQLSSGTGTRRTEAALPQISANEQR